jgi:flagellar hook assembly protein FlgD
LQLAQEARVAVEVYDVSGRLVESLANGVFGAGAHRFVWNGRDAFGHECGSGTYFCLASSREWAKGVKMILAR